MDTITSSYQTFEHARAVVARHESEGVTADRLSLIGRQDPGDHRATNGVAITGAAEARPANPQGAHHAESVLSGGAVVAVKVHPVLADRLRAIVGEGLTVVDAKQATRNKSRTARGCVVVASPAGSL